MNIYTYTCATYHLYQCWPIFGYLHIPSTPFLTCFYTHVYICHRLYWIGIFKKASWSSSGPGLLGRYVCVCVSSIFVYIAVIANSWVWYVACIVARVVWIYTVYIACIYHCVFVSTPISYQYVINIYRWRRISAPSDGAWPSPRWRL